MKRIKNQPELSREIAHKILQNVLEANNLEANKIPLEVLASYSNYRRERFTLQRVIVAIILVAFMLMPLLFIAPSCTVEQGEDVGRGRPAFNVRVDTSLPIRRVTATIEGVNMPVYEMGENLYSVQPTLNGEMVIKVTLFNDQSCVMTQRVKTVDIAAPVLVSDGYADGKLNLYVEDEGLGIDYESIHALNANGELIRPVFISEEEGLVSFAYPDDTINIYIADKVGNTLQLAVMLQK